MDYLRPTFGRALTLIGCGILMAVFGCAGFLNFGAGRSAFATVASALGGFAFLIGILAFGGGGFLVIGLVFGRLLDLFFGKPPDRS